jgi:hypothetical protein
MPSWVAVSRASSGTWRVLMESAVEEEELHMDFAEVKDEKKN